MLESEPGLEIVHCGAGSDGLRDCQAYAQRLTETDQGVAVVGIFTPLTKLEQIEIGKSNKSKSNSTVLHARADKQKAKKGADKLKLV